jgi:hypothetical protein
MILRSLSYRRLVVLAVATTALSGAFIAVSTVAARSLRREAAARPVILILHGRGQLGRDSAQVRREWERTLEVGIGGLTRGPLIETNDLRLVWYADVLDPASTAAGCDAADRRPRTRARSPENTDEGEMLQLIFGFTSALFTSLYEAIPEENRASMRALVGDILYLGDNWRRCGVERRIESALARAASEDRPVVLVAHSFGSLVAYSYLRSERVQASTSPPDIHRFVTLGSMLGIPELQQLLLGRTGALSLPANVRSWVNVRHTEDPFAVPLAGATTSGEAKSVHEVVIQATAADPHDIRTYLRDPAAARAIVWAWCDAFRGTRPAACTDVRRDVP